MRIGLTIKNYRCFSEASPAKIFLKKGFTAFVGVNNSGKTSLLRFFYEFRWLFGMLSNDSHYGQFFSGQLGMGGTQEIADQEELFYNGNQSGMAIEVESLDVVQDPAAPPIVSRVEILFERVTKTWSPRFFVGDDEVDRDMVQRSGPPAQFKDGILLLNNQVPRADFRAIMAVCKAMSEAYYIPSFRHVSAYSPVEGAATNYYDIRVGRPFIDVWIDHQAGSSLQGRSQIHRLTNDIKEIFGFDELQIHSSSNRHTLHLNVDGAPFNLQGLGSGLTQFILVLGNVAFRQSSYILIDEPELNLHPSLQVKLLMKLGGYASEGVLFATHNLGLARSVAEQTYAVATDTKGSHVSEMRGVPRLAELLGELNYEGYRALGFSKLLLVKGRTGFKTFVELLRVFSKDHEFLVVPMSDLINRYSKDELQEVTRICPKTFAVIDSEKKTANEELQEGRKIFVQHCLDLNIECHVLSVAQSRTISSDRAIKEAQGTRYSALAPYEDRSAKPLWPKTDNWKIARKMDIREIDGTDLGRFLARV